jgi:hypothetical protein
MFAMRPNDRKIRMANSRPQPKGQPMNNYPHDVFCPPGMGKTDARQCMVCQQIKAVRKDERNKLRQAAEQTYRSDIINPVLDLLDGKTVAKMDWVE